MDESIIITCTKLGPNRPVPQKIIQDAACKIVHFVRHGEGRHNVLATQVKHPPACQCASGGPCVYRNPSIADAELTALGEQQARDVAKRLLAIPGAEPEVAFVSPLCRTLQTATLALSSDARLSKLQLIADERLREQHGRHDCDRRTPVEAISRRFADVIFERISPGADSLHKEDEHESESSMIARGRAFFLELFKIPEKKIVVFTHCTFSSTVLNKVFDATHFSVTEDLMTGEVRSVVLRCLVPRSLQALKATRVKRKLSHVVMRRVNQVADPARMRRLLHRREQTDKLSS